MTVLIGIIALHLLVIVRSKLPVDDRVPYVTVFLFTVVMVVFVVLMMYRMEPPE